jgi:hypothetical protein
MTMLTQTSQLRGVLPTTHVDGFSVEIIKHPKNLLEGSEHKSLLIDYHFEVTATCTGENPHYGTAGQVSFIISQFTDKCNIGLKSKLETSSLLVVLEMYQTIQSIRIVEGSITDTKSVFFVLTVKDVLTSITSSFVWTLRKEV